MVDNIKAPSKRADSTERVLSHRKIKPSQEHGKMEHFVTKHHQHQLILTKKIKKINDYKITIFYIMNLFRIFFDLYRNGNIFILLGK